MRRAQTVFALPPRGTGLLRFFQPERYKIEFSTAGGLSRWWACLAEAIAYLIGRAPHVQGRRTRRGGCAPLNGRLCTRRWAVLIVLIAQAAQPATADCLDRYAARFRSAGRQAICAALSRATGHLCGTQPGGRPFVRHSAGRQAICAALSQVAGHLCGTQPGSRPFVRHSARRQAICAALSRAAGHLCGTQPLVPDRAALSQPKRRSPCLDTPTDGSNRRP
ncbi:unnamed protein product [Nesidiocoris tenuis]|uniref:Uncharacterized protein n=1 Tax=Nesidiocoris tenuis TaxID=355587 RepID=A0A6H5HGF3_9HEMI|nr:unnamed protein product [Nesidiocoris tenuis]